jgi:hypothetical protein
MRGGGSEVERPGKSPFDRKQPVEEIIGRPRNQKIRRAFGNGPRQTAEREGPVEYERRRGVDHRYPSA